MKPLSNDGNLLPQQIAKLESDIAHQQHAYDALNDVVIEQSKLIGSLRRRLDKIESALENVEARLPDEPRSLLQEKPPHY